MRGRKKKNKKRKPRSPRNNDLRPIPDNDLCPCGSSRIYSECCKNLNIWKMNGKGQLIKSIKLSSGMADMLEIHKKNMEKELGRPLRGDDKLFPGIDPKEMTSTMVQVFIEAKIRPVILYCFLLMDGLLITQENMDKVEGRDRDLYDGFYEEYFDFDEDEKTDIIHHLVEENASLGYSKEKIFDYITSVEGDS